MNTHTISASESSLKIQQLLNGSQRRIWIKILIFWCLSVDSKIRKGYSVIILALNDAAY